MTSWKVGQPRRGSSHWLTLLCSWLRLYGTFQVLAHPAMLGMGARSCGSNHFRRLRQEVQDTSETLFCFVFLKKWRGHQKFEIQLIWSPTCGKGSVCVHACAHAPWKYSVREHVAHRGLSALGPQPWGGLCSPSLLTGSVGAACLAHAPSQMCWLHLP